MHGFDRLSPNGFALGGRRWQGFDRFQPERGCAWSAARGWQGFEMFHPERAWRSESPSAPVAACGDAQTNKAGRGKVIDGPPSPGDREGKQHMKRRRPIRSTARDRAR